MCGLVGVICAYDYGFSKDLTETFKQLLYVDAIRGDDATGVACVTKENEVHWFKDALNSAEFIQTKTYTEIEDLLYKQGRAALGHNRKKTIGDNVSKNAHPFIIDNRAVFTHNGTLIGHRKHHDTEVDSEALGMLLVNCNGDKEQIEKALSKVDGAYACVWYDYTLNKMFFLRNKERPLWYGITKHGKHILYASEPAMIYLCANRNKFELEIVKSFSEKTLYTLDTKAVASGFQEVPLSFFTSPPPTQPPQTKPKLIHSPTTPMNGISKNSWKRESKTINGRVSFYVDWVHTKKDGGFQLVGSSDERPHFIFKVDIPEEAIPESALFKAEQWLQNRLVTATVFWHEYKKEVSKGVVFCQNGKVNVYAH